MVKGTHPNAIKSIAHHILINNGPTDYNVYFL